MGDLHAMIVHHICQMVRRVSVRFEQDGVIVDSLNEVQLTARAVLPGLAIDQVIEHGVALYFQAHNMRFALCGSILGFFGGDVCTLSVVTRRETGLTAMSCERVEPFWRAKTPVCVTVLDQLVGMFAVNGRPFGLQQSVSAPVPQHLSSISLGAYLSVWTVGTSNQRTCMKNPASASSVHSESAAKPRTFIPL
jgi:hypothetical protein